VEPSLGGGATRTEKVEHHMVFTTGLHRSAMRVDMIEKVLLLRSMFSSVVVLSVRAEVRQNALIGGDADEVIPTGHLYVALIPTMKDTESSSGTDGMIILKVPRKQTFALSSVTQNNQVFDFSLEGYETDVAQDPRRGQGVVLWVGNSGINRHKGAGPHFPICTITWYIDLACSGVSTLW